MTEQRKERLCDDCGKPLYQVNPKRFTDPGLAAKPQQQFADEDEHTASCSGYHILTPESELVCLSYDDYTRFFGHVSGMTKRLSAATKLNSHMHRWRGNHSGEGYWCPECPAKMTEGGNITNS